MTTKTAKDFDESQNREIYYAADRIRACMLVMAGVRPGPISGEASRLINNLGNPSSIWMWVKNREKLFTDATWIACLDGAQNLNWEIPAVADRSLSDPLRVLAKYFPEETALCIVPELLP